MSTSFKRVISHPEELGNLSKKMSMDVNEKTGAEKELKLPAMTVSEAESPPAAVIIESDDQLNVSPSAAFRGFSTLSADDKEESMSLSGISRNELNLARLDSKASEVMVRPQRAGSGSSGTFGWFIDVHGADSTPKTKEEKKVPARKELHVETEDDVGEEEEEPTQFIDISQQGMDNGKLGQ